ncbi:hypothetical protein [Rickettsia prowazekii]|uniref:Uncharacterized protein RP854 n=2 Tax=Rickettsia prowazekii TaxID=782 RepID=Y854_RICPR|nr:hypothetical protein [Rickettsia prowazekii]Q9ZCA6.1 RecName: Full=Uncharacterized protein RP854 [Rickettsia prowazekii str. Madrid E]ADE30430.1 hypothetical protein rpr22_CDS834 [Rickettsia prowazekii str. Rp22]AFE49648.1 hypothetical protein M9W_04140 [Rickettsia prowazekii str. Chernikova]AFE50492.1 hypothetical protein M9Y_04145 [Rickettsia prowazekii str. Katsinyian]AFE51335.1 hypothetical protein MA1_04130 [Rickettsia prowazekii str. BuV67-CWPP]AFE52173.1 hypothetical protein MA3_041
MFEKYIMYLKNLIFFQFIVYFFFISLTILIIKNFQQEYSKSILDKQVAQENLTEEVLKLYSVINSKEEILESYKKYVALSVPKNSVSCLNYQELIPRIKSLGSKYNLVEPIDVSINSVFFKNNVQVIEGENESIHVNNYSINIKYACADFLTFLKIFSEIYSYMPPNTLISFVRVRNEEVLTPKNIYKLSVNHAPNLIYTKLILYIRELSSK